MRWWDLSILKGNILKGNSGIFGAEFAVTHTLTQESLTEGEGAEDMNQWRENIMNGKSCREVVQEVRK